MQNRAVYSGFCLVCTVLCMSGGTQTASGQSTQERPAAAGTQKTQDGEERRSGGPGVPPGPAPVFGEVVAVRADVLQMRAMGSKGLTRVILAPGAMIIRDETLKTDDLKPGMKVTGSGRPVEGTGTETVPMKVEVLSVQIEGGGGSPFNFFGGGAGALMRGKQAAIFRKQNYSGSISFDARVKSVHPLALMDDQGKALPVVIGDNVEVHERRPRPVKEGDITAGARLMAMGEKSADGLLNAHMIMLFGAGGGQGTISGALTRVDEQELTVLPRFETEELKVTVSPSAKVYLQERLDLDSIQVGDSLTFTGRVLRGDMKTPTSLVVRTITSSESSETPKIEAGGGGGPFGGGSMTATVKGKITAFDPLRVQAEDGREVIIRVPGQIAYVRYHPAEHSGLKAGQKVILSGQSKEGGLVVDTIVLTPSSTTGQDL